VTVESLYNGLSDIDYLMKEC